MSKKKALGQFFTPEFIVEFIYDMILKMRPKDELTQPRIIDPACGEGIFLKYAIKNNITRPELVFGIDKDEEISKVWDELGLSKIIGKNLYIQDGLYDTPDCRVFTKYENRKFDIVVGNPPYGGIGIKNLEKDEKLYNALKKYELWKNNFRKSEKKQEGIFSDESISNIKKLSKEEIIRIERFPIEVLFLERFIQLAKLNGIIGIIIPEGILANSNMQYVRDWIMSKCDIEAIVSLPRSTFKDSGTTAKTAILFLRRLKENEVVPNDKYIFMASMEDDSKENFNKREEMKNIVNAYKNSELSIKLNPTRIIKDVKWGDIIRGRANPEFWLPEYKKLVKNMKKKWIVKELGEFIESINYGKILTDKKRKFIESGIFCINQINVRNTGIDWTLNPRFVSENDPRNVEKYKPNYGNILFNRDQVGTIGRCCIFTLERNKFCINDHIDLICIKNINSYYVCAFLICKYGKKQIERYTSGVSGITSIDFPDIKSIIIPIIDTKYQKKIEKEYLEMLDKHYKALDFKQKGDYVNFKNYVSKAEDKLNNLTKRLEELIEGKMDCI